MWVVHVTRLVVSNWRTWLRVIPLALVVVALTVSSGITNARQLSDEQKNIASYGSTSGLFSLQEDVPPGTPVPIPRNTRCRHRRPFPSSTAISTLYSTMTSPTKRCPWPVRPRKVAIG